MQLSQVILNNPLETLFWSFALSALVMGLWRGVSWTMQAEEEF